MDDTKANPSSALLPFSVEMSKILSYYLYSSDIVCFACDSEDDDIFAQQIITNLGNDNICISLAYFWNRHVNDHNLNLYPIFKKYEEPDIEKANILIIFKPIIFDHNIIKTNLTNLLQTMIPSKIIIASIVLYEEVIDKLDKEFPDSILNKIVYLDITRKSTINKNNIVVTPDLIKNRRVKYTN